MFKRNWFVPMANFEGEGGSGGTGGTPGTGGNQPGSTVAPWGADPKAAWMVGDKPWYDVYVPEGPTRQLYADKKYANPVQAFDAHFAANRMVNGNAIEIPAQDAPPEAWKGVFDKLGRPSDINGYKFEYGNGPDGKPLQANPKLEAVARQIAFDNGLSPKRAQAMVEAYNKVAAELQAEATTQAAQANAQEVEAVNTKWGAKKDEMIAAGRRVVSALGLDAAQLNRIEGSIGGGVMMELFARIGNAVKEGKMVGGSGAGDANDISQMTPQQAQAEINRLTADAEFAKKYGDAKHPEHAAAVDQISKLYARLAPATKS